VDRAAQEQTAVMRKCKVGWNGREVQQGRWADESLEMWGSLGVYEGLKLLLTSTSRSLTAGNLG